MSDDEYLDDELQLPISRQYTCTTSQSTNTRLMLTSIYDPDCASTSTDNPDFASTSTDNPDFASTSTHDPDFASTSTYDPDFASTSTYNLGHASTNPNQRKKAAIVAAKESSGYVLSFKMLILLSSD